MLAVISWLVFLSVASTPSYSQPEPGYYESIVEAGRGVVGYPGQLRVVDAEFARHYLAIAYLESGYSDQVVGPAGEKCHLQIHPLHQKRVTNLGHTWQNIIEPWRCLDVALSIYNEQGWRPWSTARMLGIVR